MIKHGLTIVDGSTTSALIRVEQLRGAASLTASELL